MLVGLVLAVVGAASARAQSPLVRSITDARLERLARERPESAVFAAELAQLDALRAAGDPPLVADAYVPSAAWTERCAAEAEVAERIVGRLAECRTCSAAAKGVGWALVETIREQALGACATRALDLRGLEDPVADWLAVLARETNADAAGTRRITHAIERCVATTAVATELGVLRAACEARAALYTADSTRTFATLVARGPAIEGDACSEETPSTIDPQNLAVPTVATRPYLPPSIFRVMPWTAEETAEIGSRLAPRIEAMTGASLPNAAEARELAAIERRGRTTCGAPTSDVVVLSNAGSTF